MISMSDRFQRSFDFQRTLQALIMSEAPSLTVRITVCIIILCLYWLCWGPLVLRAGYRFKQNSDKMIITKRNPRITLLHSMVIAGTGIIIYSPIFLLYTSDFHPSLTIIAYYANLAIYPFAAYSFIWGLAVKYWWLLFKIQWIRSTQNATWKIHINQSKVDHNWFLRHKQTLGSTPYTLKIASVIYILSILSYYAVVIVYGDLSMMYSLVQLIIILIPTTISGIAWYKTPKLFDDLHYVQECRWMMRICIAYFVTYFIVGMSPMLGATDYIRQILGNIVGTTGKDAMLSIIF